MTLDVVELLFKEQYLNGSDMWRYKMQLEGKCVHLKKSIEFCGMRCVVREMWANGEIVTCGYISDVTRVSHLHHSHLPVDGQTTKNSVFFVFTAFVFEACLSLSKCHVYHIHSNEQGDVGIRRER